MAVNEQIVTGRKFRKLIDETNKLWQRISFWTKASDVEFDNGMTAEMKMGAIDGITDSLASTSSRIAASAKSVATLNNHLAQQPNFIYDSAGKITGYKTPGGADTVFPFSVRNIGTMYVQDFQNLNGQMGRMTFSCPSKPKMIILAATNNIGDEYKEIPSGTNRDIGNAIGQVWISKEVNGSDSDIAMGRFDSVIENITDLSFEIVMNMSGFGRVRYWV